MGSLISKSNSDVVETPKNVPFNPKRIEDPRSPTQEICRTPIEVEDRSKDSTLRLQNLHGVYECSPQLKGLDLRKARKPLQLGEDLKNTSGLSLVSSAEEKENVEQ